MKQIRSKYRRGNMVQVAMCASLAAALVSCGAAAAAQTASSANLAPQSSLFISVGASVPRPVTDQVIREIDDPHSGARWLLMRNDSHPAGPGRLVLIAATCTQPEQGEHEDMSRCVTKEKTHPQPVIRTGDRLIVEENTAVIEARLEAVALGPATLGSAFDVRLKIGGKVARAVALAQGRAAFQSGTEAHP
jgi:hypothetical protein